MKIKRKTPALLALALSAVFALNMSACGNKAGKAEAEITVWSASSTEKILRDKVYEDVRQEGYKVDVFRNETESAQVIFTPTADIDGYSFAVADLKSESGDVLKKECFEVYHEKYVEIKKSTNNTDSELGWYPDCLLPLDVAAEYGENAVAENENQGIWIETVCPKEQPAGVYTGTFTLTADGKTIEVPASVEVYDYALSDVNHTRSVFNIGTYYWDKLGLIAASELDSTIEMYDKYAEMLLKYRCNPADIVGEAHSATGDTDYFVERLLKYRQYKNFNTYTIPYISATDPKTGVRAIDYELFIKYIDAIAQASVEEGVNLFEGATTYFQMYDEASLQGSGVPKEAETFFNTLFDIIAEHIDELRGTLQCENEQLKTEILNGIRDIQHLYIDSEYGSAKANVTYCPSYSTLNDEDTRKQFTNEPLLPDREQEAGKYYEKWWYSALSPLPPSPNLHIDNEQIVPRLEGWMRYENGVVGYLYWSANFTVNNVTKEPVGDFYGTTITTPNTNGANGDGYLVYPGKPYGVDGPLPSIRLSAFRDSCEDYELLLALESEYEKVAAQADTGVDVDGVYKLIKDKLYSNLKYDFTSDVFSMARKELATLLVVAEKGGAIIRSAQSDGVELTLDLLVTAGQDVEFTGRTQYNETTVNGAKLFTVRADLDREDINKLQFKLVSQYVTGTYDVCITIGGKREAVTADKLGEVSKKSDLTAEVVSGNDFGMEGSAMAVTSQTAKSLIGFISDSEAVQSIDDGIRYIEFDVYSDSDADVTFTVYATGKRNGVAQTVYMRKLAAKTVTRIRLEVCFFNFKTMGSVADMEFEVRSDDGSETVRGLYVSDMTYIRQMNAV